MLIIEKINKSIESFPCFKTFLGIDIQLRLILKRFSSMHFAQNLVKMNFAKLDNAKMNVQGRIYDTCFYKHNVYKHPKAQISKNQKTKHILSIF